MDNFWLFLPLAIIAIATAVLMVTSHNAIHSALWLVLNFTTIAVFYIILNAPFIAMVQITVYAGAIMVLFLFVIMLLGAERLGGLGSGDRGQLYLGLLIGIALIIVFGFVLMQGGGTSSAFPAVEEIGPTAFGAPAPLGLRLFERYVFPFELTGALLLAAMIGVVVLSKRKQS